jgi:hypothetical protein
LIGNHTHRTLLCKHQNPKSFISFLFPFPYRLAFLTRYTILVQISKDFFCFYIPLGNSSERNSSFKYCYLELYGFIFITIPPFSYSTSVDFTSFWKRYKTDIQGLFFVAVDLEFEYQKSMYYKNRLVVFFFKISTKNEHGHFCPQSVLVSH